MLMPIKGAPIRNVPGHIYTERWPHDGHNFRTCKHGNTQMLVVIKKQRPSGKEIINDIHVSVVDVPCHGLQHTMHKTFAHYCNNGLNNKLHAYVFKDIQDLHLKAMTYP